MLRTGVRRLPGLFALLCGISMAWADVDISEYESKSALSSSREQQQMWREIEQEKAAERRRAEAEAELEARRRAEEAQRQAARPYAERLLDARCTVCHGAANYYGKRHTRFGWWLVVLRMRHMNGAFFEPAEQGVILAELAHRYGPGWAEWGLEYGALAVALVAPPVLGWGALRLVRRLRAPR